MVKGATHSPPNKQTREISRPWRRTNDIVSRNIPLRGGYTRIYIYKSWNISFVVTRRLSLSREETIKTPIIGKMPFTDTIIIRDES